VVMEYQNRLGSFDILPMSHVANVIYTSAENSGPVRCSSRFRSLRS